MILRVVRSLVLVSLLVPLQAWAQGQTTKLLRFPDLYGDRVVFTYAGDLWLAPTSGGTATRLTTHPGLELFGKFSPDGEWIAFTGQYDGDEQVYVIPATGGVPRQLTFYPANGPLAPRWGYDNQVYGWHPDGSKVLFRSMRDGWDLGDTQLFLVDVDGGLPTPLPMPSSGGGDLSADGGRVVYSPVTRDFRAWKRYEGGWAQDLYIFDLDSLETTRITDDPRSDRDPMWIGDTVYFSSDRDGKLNLYAYDTTDGSIRQLTRSDTWDVRWPSADHQSGRIVYELDGELEIYDTAADASSPVPIRVPTDALAMRPGHQSVARYVEDFGLSPSGERALFAARGDIFTAPIEHGPTRNLTRSSGAHDREPSWSPDGRKIGFVSDLDGEEELYWIDQIGEGEPQQLTDGSRGRYYGLLWSPDSKSIAYRNQAAKLFVVDVESRQVTEIADDGAAFGLDYNWSPHSGYLVYSLAAANGFRSLFLWTAADGSNRRLTDELFNEFSPSFGTEGDYLYFLSDREFGPQLGSFEFDYVVNRETYIYAMALRDDVAGPFPPRSDEVKIDDEEGDESEAAAEASEKGKSGRKGKTSTDEGDRGEPESGEGEDEAEASAPIEIDFDGLARRVSRVPLEADNYGFVEAIEGHLLYFRSGPAYYARDNGETAELYAFDLEERDSSKVADDVRGVVGSADGKKILVASDGSYRLIDLPDGGEGKPVSTAGLQVDRVPSEEWRQIFHEVWRRFRDFFYVENMHGYDWVALRQRYLPQLEYVAHRSDLNYVISEMLAELSVSHAYIAGGDYEIPERPDAALLGARFELDADSGRYRFTRIFAGHNEEPRYRSPLTEVGVNVDVGDYLLQINGVDLTAEGNPFELLRHVGGDVVELLVSDTPDASDGRRVMVDPVGDEDPLIYLDWVESNRRVVAEATDGRVGYIHLPDMGSSGIREWIKWYYGQIRKQGLVIDVRSNGGGNVSSMIIERLRRTLLMLDFERNVDLPDTYPGTVFTGQLVCLIDEDTASDGDQFAYVFRQAGLGPVIGKRTWGGVVGIYGRGPLIDGGSLSVPEAGSANAAGEWVIEGHGVDPDIVVDNDPKDLLEGRDAQLEKAIEVIVERIESNGYEFPQRPAPPVKAP